LYGPDEELKRRFLRKHSSDEFNDADLIKNQEDISKFAADADVRINTSYTDGEDTFVRVAARLRLYAPPDLRCVDVLVGGQYGSEGKGHVAAYLAKEYDVLVRVGGPNAGHTVSGQAEVFTYHQLPSGSQDTDARLLLGPGMTIHVESLLQEIEKSGINPERLYIDPQAMVILDSDRDQETGLRRSISSTGSGSGSAAARRIMGRGAPETLLARDVEQLRPYVGLTEPYRGCTALQLELAYNRGESVLVEGTQGSGLSIYHGQYPHVTSRDTNVAGCLAEAGISPSRVRRVLMVIRPTPIRVANPEGEKGTSGRLKHETTFADVALRAGLNSKEVETHEITSTTKRNRRVGWFEWDQFRLACSLNAPTDIVLTFADYLNAKNADARRFEQLSSNTIKFVEELERVAQAPVSLINTRFPRTDNERFDLRTIIDRRNWRTERKTGPMCPIPRSQ
jgi:adenylosuccinate synthase